MCVWCLCGCVLWRWFARVCRVGRGCGGMYFTSPRPALHDVQQAEQCPWLENASSQERRRSRMVIRTNGPAAIGPGPPHGPFSPGPIFALGPLGSYRRHHWMLRCICCHLSTGCQSHTHIFRELLGSQLALFFGCARPRKLFQQEDSSHTVPGWTNQVMYRTAFDRFAMTAYIFLHGSPKSP